MNNFIDMRKPCPHCGSLFLGIGWGVGGDHQEWCSVMCRSCSSRGPQCLSESDAWVGWNSRAFKFNRIFNYFVNKLILFWDRLWIRKNEFHKSLDFNADLYLKLSPKEREKYDRDLTKRRYIAHERDLLTERIKK